AARTESIARWFFLLLAVAVAALFWSVVHPYAISLVTAGIVAVVLSPLDDRLRRVVRHPRITALLLLALVFFVMIGPLTTIGIVMVQQALEIVSATVANPDWIANFRLEEVALFQALPRVLRDYVVTIDFVSVLRGAAQWASTNVGVLFESGASFVLNLFIFFVALFYFLVDRERIAKEMLVLSPLRDTVDHEIAARMVGTVRGVIFGSLIVSVVQGILAGIGLTIFGVPGALLWASMVLVAAQIPMLGTSVVMLPAVAYLFVVGDVGSATGLLVWSVLIVASIDNVLKPYVVGGKTRMHGLLILVSMLGGLQTFGPIGFILGATNLLVCTVVLVLSVFSLPADIKSRAIQTVTTKPVQMA
ncbi:AI-2E family transporter, partial [bacterium]|nr:AI-2E family transporter [bacterium]